MVCGCSNHSDVLRSNVLKIHLPGACYTLEHIAHSWQTAVYALIFLPRSFHLNKQIVAQAAHKEATDML